MCYSPNAAAATASLSGSSALALASVLCGKGGRESTKACVRGFMVSPFAARDIPPIARTVLSGLTCGWEPRTGETLVRVRASRRASMAGAVALVLLAGAASAAVGQPADQVPAAAPATAPTAPASLRPDQISLLELMLSSADTEGLKPDSFLTPPIELMLRSPDPATRLNGEAGLVSATLDY